jgi:GNAT superfamily N-acetyltransferase
MRIERFDPRADADALHACYQLHRAATEYDDPEVPPMTPAAFRNWWACGFTGNPQQTWMARDAAGPAGCYLLELPDRDNTRTGFLVPFVPPAQRRRGIGTALLAHASDQARQAGRRMLAGDALAGSAGDAFARAAGGRAGLTEVRRILPVGPDLPGRLTRLRAQAEAAAGGYTVIGWRGPVPAEHLTAVAAVVSAISDAPRDEAIEPGSWDADRVRQIGEWTAEAGLKQFSVAARHDSSGELAALSQALLEPGTPDWAFQQITAVARPHRGHRLGLLVKTALHQQLLAADPAIRQVMTTNAAANEHMIAINELMGYRPGSRFQSWELDLAG